ncbi:hypothetical protein AB0K62_08840 [Streptomyces halstedii]|uniref:hypothetical protein n=1 Tax=Streptomyces halstedii TaxID=1944 RepID=UPI0034616CAB
MTTDHAALTPAERLRAAAARLRTLLNGLGDCRGPWYVVNREAGRYPQRIDNVGVPYVVATTTTDPSRPSVVADYIALMHPRVGYVLAQWLEASAERVEDGGDWAARLDPQALLAANLLLAAPVDPNRSVVTDRPEPTLRDRMAAAIYEMNNPGRSWAAAHPDDLLCYGWDADAALLARDAEMAELRRQVELSDAVTAETKKLLERRTTSLRRRAERAESVTEHALTELADSGGGFARGFRLVQRDGHALDGAVFPSGHAFVLDDPEYGLVTVAASVEDLLRGGYHGARIEWTDQAPAEHCGHQPSEVFTWRHPGRYSECVLRPGHQGSHADEHGMRWWEAANPTSHLRADVTPGAGLPPAQPCTDPRHTVAVREQLGCTGPDPASAVTDTQPAVPPGGDVVADPHP